MKAPLGEYWVKALVLTALAVPVLYLLTFPPIAVFASTRPPGPYRDPTYPLGPAWLVSYGQPYRSLMEESLARGPLKAYFDWWWIFRYP